MNHWFFLPLDPFSCQLFLLGNRIHPPMGLAVPGPLASLGCQASTEDAFPSPLLLRYQLALFLTRTAVNTLEHCSPPHPSHSLLPLHQRGSPTRSGKEDVLQHEWDTNPAGCSVPGSLQQQSGHLSGAARSCSKGRRVSPEQALLVQALESLLPPTPIPRYNC